MYIRSLENETINSIDDILKKIGYEMTDALKNNKYDIYRKFFIEENAFFYAAIIKDFSNAAKSMLLPELSCFVYDDGTTSTINETSAPLLKFLYDKEFNLSEAEYEAIYPDVFKAQALTKGLTPQQAKIKLEDRKELEELIEKILKLKEEKAPKENTKSDKYNVLLKIEPYNYNNYFRVGIDLVKGKDIIKVENFYRFSSNFDGTTIFNLSNKYKVKLSNDSFFPPYDNVISSLCKNMGFSSKGKQEYGVISSDNLAEILSKVLDNYLIYGNVKQKINTDLVSFVLSDKGVPEFTPSFSSSNIYAKDGVFVFDKKNIKFYEYPTRAIKEIYLYFRQKGFDNYDYVADIFTKNLVPILSKNLSSKKKVISNDNPFNISLYISINEKSELVFNTKISNNGSEITMNDLQDYENNLYDAYAEILKSMGGIDNGIIKGDDNIVKFLQSDISSIQKFASLYVEDRLKPKNISDKPQLRFNAKRNGNYLDLTVDSDKYNHEELVNIVNSYKKKKKYVLLNDSVILLTDNEITKQLDNFEENKTENKKLPLYEIFSLNDISVEYDDKLKNILTEIKEFSESKIDLPEGWKKVLRPYQIEAVKYLNVLSKYNFGGILADEMGLGKTIETICHLDLIKTNKPILVVTPKNVLYNWQSEIERFSKIESQIIDGSRIQREKKINSINQNKKCIYLVSYDTLKMDIDLVENIEFSVVILDEAQNIKNSFSNRHQALMRIKSDNRFALSGTPIENSVFDLISIADFLLPGYLDSEKKLVNNPNYNYSNIKIKIKPFILRRKKKDVLDELPPKEEINIIINMADEERKLYLGYLEEARNKSIAEKGISMFSYIMRLRQLCVDPSTFIEDYDLMPTKFNYLINNLKENLENGHKVLVFSSFKVVLDNLSSYLNMEDIKYDKIDGTVDSKSRLDIAKKFNDNRTSAMVLLVSLKAGGVGLNLVGADIIYHLDPWWNPQIENQANDRAHRIGQINKVTVYRLIMRDSIEQKVLELEEMKKEIYNELIDENGVNKLSMEDISFLLN